MTTLPPTDPTLADAVINTISTHSTNCQDVDCQTCDQAMHRANLVLDVVAEWLHEVGQHEAADLVLDATTQYRTPRPTLPPITWRDQRTAG